MSFSKYILPILMQFFTSRNNDSGLSSQSLFLKAVTTTVKKEISGLILKIIFACVVTGVLIFSLIILGQHFQTYLLLSNNGILFSVLFFSLVAIACVFAVVQLFNQKAPLQDPFEFLAKGEKHFSISTVYNNFMDGLADGLSEEQTEEFANSKKTEEPKYKYSGPIH